MMAHVIRKSYIKSKFFLQISDYQQSVVLAPSMGLPHIPTSRVVADYPDPKSRWSCKSEGVQKRFKIYQKS